MTGTWWNPADGADETRSAGTYQGGQAVSARPPADWASAILILSSSASAADNRGSFEPLFVNAGGNSYTDSNGRLWSADQKFRAGGWGHVGGNEATIRNEIGNTDDDALYQSGRWYPSGSGFSGYRFAVPDGAYEVKLHFAEISSDVYRKGARVFDLQIEGRTVLNRLDVYALVGRNSPLVLRAGKIRVTDGSLDIGFVERIQSPMISAIEVRK